MEKSGSPISKKNAAKVSATLSHVNPMRGECQGQKLEVFFTLLKLAFTPLNEVLASQSFPIWKWLYSGCICAAAILGITETSSRQVWKNKVFHINAHSHSQSQPQPTRWLTYGKHRVPYGVNLSENRPAERQTRRSVLDYSTRIRMGQG